MTENEKKLFEAVPANEFNTYWVPCTWFIFRLQEAAKHGKLLNQYALESIMRVSEECFIFYFNKVNRYRTKATTQQHAISVS